MIQLVTIYVVVIFAALVFLFFAFVAILRGIIGREAPFIRSPWTAVNVLENFLDLDLNSVFCDLGCGDGRVMRTFYERFPEAQYVGIEKNFLPYLAFNIRNRDIIGKNFSVIRADIFRRDLSTATHIFVYLFPPMMGKLEAKLERELKRGAVVISLDFPLLNKKPKEIVKFYDKSRQERLIYVYEF